MGKQPAFQMYAADFHMDTCDWTVDQVGIYTRLLMYAWVNGFIPEDPKRLARISGCSVKKFNVNWKVQTPKWKKKGIGKLVNPKMEEVRRNQVKYIKSQREKANKRWGKNDAAAMPQQCSSTSTSTSIYNINNSKGETPFFECLYFTVESDKAAEYLDAFSISQQTLKMELQKMKMWLDDNPAKRKKQYPNFIRNWLGKVKGTSDPVSDEKLAFLANEEVDV